MICVTYVDWQGPPFLLTTGRPTLRLTEWVAMLSKAHSSSAADMGACPQQLCLVRLRQTFSTITVRYAGGRLALRRTFVANRGRSRLRQSQIHENGSVVAAQGRRLLPELKHHSTRRCGGGRQLGVVLCRDSWDSALHRLADTTCLTLWSRSFASACSAMRGQQVQATSRSGVY